MQSVVLRDPFCPTHIATPSWLIPIANYPPTKIVLSPRHLPSKGAIKHPTNWKTPTSAVPVPGLIEKLSLPAESSLSC